MKIVDYGYLIPSLVIILGIPLLIYLKLAQQPTKSLDVTIYGSTIEAALLAYYIDKNIEQSFGSQNKKYMNITIVSPFDAPSSERTPKQTDKTLLTFCGVENHLLDLLNDLDMQFQINEYGIYFSQLERGKGHKEADLSTYKIQQEYPIKSLFEYGLSHITAKNIFQDFESHLSDHSRPRKMQDLKWWSIQELSMASSIRHLFPYQFEESGIKYLSETIGLDQQYIHDYIMPVIWGSYLHEPNSITTLLKLLPLYCTQNKVIGSSLAILVDESQLYQKLIAKIKYININHVYNHYLQGFQLLKLEGQNQQTKSPQRISNNKVVNRKGKQGEEKKLAIEVTYLNTFVNQTKQKQDDEKDGEENREDGLSYEKLRTDLLFIIEDYEMANKKEISYYKTVVDGKIKGDENFQEYFTLYLTYQRPSEEEEESVKNNKYIYSATRLCKENCKNFNKNVYLLISKQKLTEKDLGMFEEHHIIYYKKFWLPKTQLPSTKKFQEIESVYRLYDTESISDSYEFKLTVLDELSHTVINKMTQDI